LARWTLPQCCCDARFERLVRWSLREDKSLDRAAAEQRTFADTARMPAWAQHPRVVAAADGGALN
jgi:hypothetical protein